MRMLRKMMLLFARRPGPTGPPGGVDTLLINSTDALLINGTDRLKI